MRRRVENTIITIPGHIPGHWLLLIHIREGRRGNLILQADSLWRDKVRCENLASQLQMRFHDTPYYDKRKDRWKILDTVHQVNTEDCGIHMLLTAYIFLHHPDPQRYKWHPNKPDAEVEHTSGLMRRYVAHALITQLPMNIMSQNIMPEKESTMEKSSDQKTVQARIQGHGHRNKRQKMANKDQAHKSPQEQGHQCKIASWNLQGSFDPHNIIMTCLLLELDYLVCQEPVSQYTQKENRRNLVNGMASRAGYTPFFSKNTIILTSDTTITRMIHVDPIVIQKGRAQVHMLQLHHQLTLLILGVYTHTREDTPKPTNPPKAMQPQSERGIVTEQRTPKT